MKLDQILKKLPDGVVEEMKSMDEQALQKAIAESEEAIAKAQHERDENPKYVAAKQAVKDLSEGLRSLRTYQRAKIHFALIRIQELREETSNE